MGSFFSRICRCLFPSKRPSDERQPLLDDDGEPKFVPYQRGSVSSARRHPSRPSVDKGSGVKASLRKIAIESVGLDDLDEQYKIHSEAFNDCLDRYNQLTTCYHRMLSAYDNQGCTHSNLSQVFKIYKHDLDENQKKSINIKRKHQFCVQLNFNGEKIPGEGAQIFEDFNMANLITKDITEKEPIIVSNAMMLVSNEGQFNQRIREHYESDMGKCPEKLKICVNNTAEMKKVKPFMEYMRKETGRMFEDLKESVRVFAH